MPSTATCSSLLLLLAVLVVPTTHGQLIPEYWAHSDYTVRQWTVLDGLPQNSVNAIVQTRDGYLWMGTFGGLVRFDGLRFTVFDLVSAPGLASNRITALYEARDGTLWMGHEDGEISHYRDGTFTHYTTDDGLPGGRVWSFAEDAVGHLWIGAASGLVRFAEGVFTSYTTDDGLPHQSASRVLVDRQGVLWVGTDSGLAHHTEGRFIAIPTDGLPGRPVLALFEDRAGTLWLGTDQGALVRNMDGRFERVSLPGRSAVAVSFLEEDQEGNLWVGTQAGDLIRLAGATAGAAPGNDGGSEMYPLGGIVRSVMADQEGSLWVGTVGGGLHRLRKRMLTRYTTDDGLPDQGVFRITGDGEGGLWVSTGCGALTHFRDGVFTTYRTDNSGIAIGCVYALLLDREGTLWFGNSSATGPRLSRVLDGTFTTYEDDLPPGEIHALFEDQAGALWISTEGGVVRRKNGQSTHFTTDDGLLHNDVRFIMESRDGAMWFGSTDGLSRLQDGAFTNYTAEDGLSSGMVRAIHEDQDTTLWVGTYGGGLSRLKDGVITRYTMDNGLFENVVSRILEDEKGNLWMLGNLGLFYVNRQQLNAFAEGQVVSVHSMSFGPEDGMIEGNGGGMPAGWQTQDGRMWFPTTDGIVMIDTKHQPLDEVPPPVAIEQMRIDREAVDLRQAVEVPPGPRDVEITYTGLSYVKPEQMRFKYKLEGYDTAWQEVGTRRTAYYTSLSPGSYTFWVQAAKNDGAWNEAGASLSFTITPPWYRTWWFYGLVGVFFAVGGPLFYVLRVRQLKAREAALEHTVAERTARIRENEAQLEEQADELRRANALKSRFLANISHEFRTPLTLTFGPLDDIANRRFASLEDALPHVDRARRNGSRLLRLINQLLDLSKLDAGALLLHARRYDLAKHLRQMAALFESMALRQGLHLHTEIPQDRIPHIYDTDKLEKIVINLLSNAFKFTPSGGKVSLRFEQEADGTACITVADTGPGIAQEDLPRLFDRFFQVDSAATRAHEGSGIGLSLVKELVELHEGTIAVESQVGFGTRFTVRLPVLKEVSVDEDEEAQLETDAAAPVERVPLLELAPGDGGSAGTEEQAPQAEMIHEEETVVLVVEDNADMRAYIRAHLEARFIVVEAENGRVGVERARELVPDLVLSDVMMPEMDGLAVCQALKTDTATSHIPVVLLTARAQVEHRIAGFESGADAYLPKPFNAKELQVRVRTLIQERRRLRTLFASEAAVEGGVVDAEEEAPVAVLPPREAAFLEQVHQIIAARLAEAGFGVDALAETALMSRRQLHRKLLALTGETPAALLRRMRLDEAAVLLRAGELSVKEVCYAVGFQSESSFRRAFRQVFGTSPSAYAEQV